MNLPNKLTLGRIGLVPVLVFCLLAGELSDNSLWLMANHWAALLIFIVASVSDLVDGHIARKYNLVTNFGRLADPLADKLLIVSTFICCIVIEELRFPAWLVIVIMCREFIVTGLRTLGVTQQRVIHADWWGKHKTISQMVTLITAMAYLCISDSLKHLGYWEKVFRDHELQFWGDLLIRFLVFYCLFATLISGVMYLYRNRDLLSDN